MSNNKIISLKNVQFISIIIQCSKSIVKKKNIIIFNLTSKKYIDLIQKIQRNENFINADFDTYFLFNIFYIYYKYVIYIYFFLRIYLNTLRISHEIRVKKNKLNF